jgi:hypothetical protein
MYLNIVVTSADVGLTEKYMLVRCAERWPQIGISAEAEMPCTALRHVSVKQRASVMPRGTARQKPFGMRAKHVFVVLSQGAESDIVRIVAAKTVASRRQGRVRNAAAIFNQRMATERHVQKNAQRQEAGDCFNATTK